MSWRHQQGYMPRTRGSWRGGYDNQNAYTGHSDSNHDGNWRSGAKWRYAPCKYGGNWRDNEQDHEAETETEGDHFVVRHPSIYEGETSTLQPPTVLGSFSKDRDKNLRFNDSMMPVLSKKYLPEDNESMEVELDLNRGWHRVNGYTGTTTETFRQFLQWILENQKKLTAKDASDRLMADVVCTRGILKSIMQMPCIHPNFCEVVILAQYFKGSVYMSYQYEDHEGQKEKEKSSLIEIYGHKFEQYMTGGDPDDVLECDCQFRCVLKLQLNEMVLLYPTATDGIDQTRHKKNFTDMSSFVILKARKDDSDPFKQRNFRRNNLNTWWIESQLSGIPRLLLGLRSQEGVVHTLQMLKTTDFPHEAEGEWEPSVCINFLTKFLNFVKEKVLSEPDTVHRFERSVSSLKYVHHYHDSTPHILPKWYREKLFVTEENSD